MKKTRIRAFIAALLAVLLLGGCGVKIPQELTDLSLPYVDGNIVTAFSVVLPQRGYLTLTSENQQLMYKAMLLAIKNHDTETLAVPGDLTDAEVAAVYDAVTDDYPQFFEPSLTYSIVREQTKSGKVKSISCTLNYIENDPELAVVRRQALYDRVNAILAEAATITDTLEREKFFYEQVIYAAEYDYSQSVLANINLDTHTAYGCLVDGKAVCDGYAKAFALLCCYGGIEAWTESGYLDNTSHAWNGIKLDGKVYYCDPTADDAENRYYDADKDVVINPETPEDDTALPDTATLLYFNLTRGEMSADHTFKSSAGADDAADSASATVGIFVRFESRGDLADWMNETLANAQSGSGFTIAVDFSISKSDFAELIQNVGMTNTCLFSQNGAASRYYIYVI